MAIRVAAMNISDGAGLGTLEVVPVMEDPLHYTLTIPNFNSTAGFYYLVVVEAGTNRTAFKEIVRIVCC